MIRRRTVYLMLPTKDGGQVNVTSRTVAERLVGQAQAIEYLTKSSRSLGLELGWQRERLLRLTRALPVAVLLRLRLVKLEPEKRPEGWPPEEAPVELGSNAAGPAASTPQAES